MPDKPSETAPDPVPEIGSPTDAVIDTLTVRQQEAIQTLESASTALLAGVTRAQREIAGFVSERIRHDMETQQELLRCKSLDDVRDVQTRFFKTALEQYSAEATRLMRLSGEIVGKSIDRGPS